MKFMMNGALTVGTRDGATIEMARAAGEANFLLFGLTAAQVAGRRARDHPRIVAPIREARRERGDRYMHLADLTSYAEAQSRLAALYRDPHAWTRKAIANVAASGRFSSDRTITEYA